MCVYECNVDVAKCILLIFIRTYLHKLSNIECFRCYVGRRHIEAAIKSFDKNATVSVIWKPYLLNANADPKGVPMLEYGAKRFESDFVKMALEGKSRTQLAGQKVVCFCLFFIFSVFFSLLTLSRNNLNKKSSQIWVYQSAALKYH